VTVTDLLSYDDALTAFDPVMGLEVHVELGTMSKILRDRAVVPLRAEELLLSGHAEELPDLAV